MEPVIHMGAHLRASVGCRRVFVVRGVVIIVALLFGLVYGSLAEVSCAHGRPGVIEPTSF